MIREVRVLIDGGNGDPDFGANYYITAYEVGAQVTSASAGTTITVRAGHGFAALDKLLLVDDFPFTSSYRTVSSVGATTLTINSALSVAQGDLLVNLGQDTGSTEPTYIDGRGAGFPTAIYTDMAYANLATNSTVQSDDTGRAYYYHQGISIWELVRSPLNAPIAVYQSASVTTIPGAATATTDNAVARWDGVTGLVLQNSVVTIGDTGATTGITTLNASGAVTFSSTLVIGGTLSGVTTLTVVTVTASGNATVGGTLGVTGATTLASTLAVTGATTLTGGVTGNVVATGNVTSGGHLIGKKTSLSVSTSTTVATAGTLIVDITNTTGTNSCTLVAPSGGDGQLLILRIAAVSAGSFTLTESTTAQLVGTTWAPDGAGDTLTLVSAGTVFTEIARSNN